MRNPALIDTAEVTIETLYHLGHRHFLARLVAAIASRCFGVGSHGAWHLHSDLGECHRLRICGYACIHALARNAQMSVLAHYSSRPNAE